MSHYKKAKTKGKCNIPVRSKCLSHKMYVLALVGESFDVKERMKGCRRKGLGNFSFNFVATHGKCVAQEIA